MALCASSYHGLSIVDTQLTNIYFYSPLKTLLNDYKHIPYTLLFIVLRSSLCNHLTRHPDWTRQPRVATITYYGNQHLDSFFSTYIIYTDSHSHPNDSKFYT